MPKLFDQKNTDDKKNAILFFGNQKQIKVKAYGKSGIFEGYLTFIEGLFSIADIQNNCNEQQFFVTENINVEIGNIDNNKHIVCFAKNFFNIENIVEKYKHCATLIADFTPKDISFYFNKNINYENFNHIKCVLYFPDHLEDGDFNTEKIEQILKNMPDRFYNLDLFKTQQNFLSYFGEKLIANNLNKLANYPILKHRKKIAVIDFGISKTLKKILQAYFHVIFVPLKESALHIKYLFYDKKIDGIVISNFQYNTYFINNDICKEIKELSIANIPLLCIGNGAILIAEVLSSNTTINYTNYENDTFIVLDKNNKQYEVSNYCNKKIEKLSKQLKEKYYDKDGNIVGFQNENIIGYTFEFTSDNIETAYFLNQFYKKIKNVKR